MTFEESQADMRRAYYDGATGVVASASAWLAAAIAAYVSTPQASIITLLIGGMFIFPASVLLSKLLGRSGAHANDNLLAPLAASSTIWMLLAIPISYGASLYRVEWFFPAMLLTIGGRYLTFATLYGLRVYFILGAVLATAAIVLVVTKLPVGIAALVGSTIEFCFGAYIFLRARRRMPQACTPADAPKAALR